MKQRWEYDCYKENVGCNECISALGVRVVSNRIRSSVSEIMCVEQEQMLIIILVRTR